MKLLKSLLYSLALLNLAPAHAQHQHQDLEKDLTQYEAARKAGTLTYDAAMKYGTLFMNSKLKDHTAAAMYRDKAFEAFKEAALKQPGDAATAFNMGTVAYSRWTELADSVFTNTARIKTLTADRVVEKDPQKKTASDAAFKEQVDQYKKINATLEPLANVRLDETIACFTKVFTSLKDKPAKSTEEKSLYQKSVAVLAQLHAGRRDGYKGKDVKRYEEENERFKTYSSLQQNFK